jgi:hypothetical protein
MKYESRPIFIIRFLPFELPSRKNDSTLVLLWRSFPYVIAGIATLAIISVSSRPMRQLPLIWFSNLASLGDWYEKVLVILLTLVWQWFGAFAIGVILIEKLRRPYRKYLVRPIEAILSKKS